MNYVNIVSLLVMLLGAAISIGIFRQLGPITTTRGMRILGGCVIILGFALGLTQSKPDVPAPPALTTSPVVKQAAPTDSATKSGNPPSPGPASPPATAAKPATGR